MTVGIDAAVGLRDYVVATVGTSCLGCYDVERWKVAQSILPCINARLVAIYSQRSRL